MAFPSVRTVTTCLIPYEVRRAILSTHTVDYLFRLEQIYKVRKPYKQRNRVAARLSDVIGKAIVAIWPNNRLHIRYENKTTEKSHLPEHGSSGEDRRPDTRSHPEVGAEFNLPQASFYGWASTMVEVEGLPVAVWSAMMKSVDAHVERKRGRLLTKKQWDYFLKETGNDKAKVH